MSVENGRGLFMLHNESGFARKHYLLSPFQEMPLLPSYDVNRP